ncbi:MAG: hypothetical protein VX473_00450 [Candidatus Thermoplasmatota archaeon]|nr:hypothetical protein [Candidatus Thermoplasmatota archaeon]
MAEDADEDTQSPSEDRIIDSRAFQLGGGIDLDAFISPEGLADAKRPALPGASPTDATAGEIVEESDDEIHDAAIGEIFEVFDQDSGPKPGDILPDGTVYYTPELDTITEVAVQGERRLHWALMVTMIVVYSLIGWIVATALDPLLATVGLIGLATLGFILGERWIPDKGMHILGVTWVIISMKLLYGLAIDAHHWGWIDTPQLGGSLIALVGVNILVGYRHKHDAIMAQATLVSLALASTAGSVAGEMGVALMILLATILLHGLAFHRKSGNLAALGIAASHLWIGLHAIQSEPLNIGALEILPLAEPMQLFLLSLAVTCINGSMAARFSRADNWFSKGISITGLGKPGLWGVSVGLGMVGALLLLASGRDETGYSLGILVTLLAVYGGSYLVVRGVEPMEVLKPLLASLPALLIALVALEANLIETSLISGYEVFAILTSIITIGMLLKHQSNVTDRVLWLGSLVLILLVTILIPAEALSEGGDEGLLLLSVLTLVHLATGALALKRESPSIAGVTVLAPWLWMFAHALWTSSLESFSEARSISVDVLIVLDPKFVALYLTFAALIQYPINLKLGDTGVNLAGKLIGATELSARLRDSGMMRLWNLSLISGLAVWLMFIDARDEVGWYSLLGISCLAVVHIAAEAQGKHQGNPRVILFCLGLTFAILQWNVGADAFWMILLTGASLAILLSREGDGPSSQMLSLTMGLLTLQLVLFGLDHNPTKQLLDPEPFDRMKTGIVMLVATTSLLAIYLPRARKLEKLLPPAIAVVCLLSVQIWASSAEEMHIVQSFLSIAVFVASAIYLAATGELRMELKQVGKRDARLAEIQRRQALAAALEKGSLVDFSPDETRLLPESNDSASPTSALAINQQSTQNPLDIARAGNLFHFADEELAAKAADDTTGTLAKSMSQAISRGGMKMADSELYALIDKQRKRRKKSGAQHNSEELDLLVGDIHHRPIIVLSFIAVTTFAACWFAWLNGQLNSGLMLMVSLFALSLTWVSRQRAKVHNLRLPDINGVEMPFFVTMGSLALIYLVGHFSPLGSKFDQMDLLVLSFGLLGLALISLYGRDDLPWRIPSAVESVILMLLITRLLGALLFNAVPFPFTINLLDNSHDLIEWQLPWIFHEITLLLMVLVWEWIEGFRRTNGMPDHRGAAGRGNFALMTVMVSAGPAGLLAGILCMKRSFNWKQPAGVSLSVYAILGGMFAFLAWTSSSEFQTALLWTLFAVGVVMLAAQIYTIFANMPKWTTAWLWNAHIILPVGVYAVAGWSPWLVVCTLALSLATWVGGILQLRRGMRIMGALDLVFSFCIALLILQGSILEPNMLLLMLVALGIELGIVAWLGTRHDMQLAQD